MISNSLGDGVPLCSSGPRKRAGIWPCTIRSQLPMEEDADKDPSDKAGCRARAYDIVLNGTELGGGSIRINTPEMQEKAFQALGISDEDIGRPGSAIWWARSVSARCLTAVWPMAWTGW